ncbi:hypothetical protein VKT23_014511 [Stygiomarasmius scandens]|uniref:Heterokaryon incompatibility domain-containing protein n=1 Tax=Marasmiellus scandens TaxID=2682957 RepID=A0ABR1J0H2_9AGAR
MGKEADTQKAIWEGLGAIKTLIDDQWFWRVWTLQESVLPSCLLMSNGTVMDFRFCNLIKWMYGALGTKFLDDHCGDARYLWIHPGAGVVNDEGWWMVSQGFLHATENGCAQQGELHPLEALVITKFRRTGREINKPRGAYGIINEQWHVLEENDFKKAWEEMVDKYINRENPDLAPLITMAITTSMQRTWGAGESERMGSVVPDHKWINKTAKLSQGTLNFTASGISRIKEVPVRATDGGGLDFVLMIFKTLMGDLTSEAIEIPIAKAMPYGDGSGELDSMTYNLRILRDQHHVDVSSILSLISRAVNHLKRHVSQSVQQTYSNLEDLDQEIFPFANAVSSGLWEIFCGWDRWIVVAQLVEEGPSQTFLAWFPKVDENEEPESVKEHLNRCLLLWTCPGSNKWAVIVEEVQGGYRKFGIAFVDSEHPGPKTDVVVLVV